MFSFILPSFKRIVSKNDEDEVVEEDSQSDNTPLQTWSSGDIVSIINALVLGILAVKVGNLSHKLKHILF